MRVIVPQARIDGAAARQDDRQRRFPPSRSDTLCIRCDRGDDRGRRGRERGSDRGTRKTCRRSPTNYKYVRQYTEKGTRATKPAVSEPASSFPETSEDAVKPDGLLLARRRPFEQRILAGEGSRSSSPLIVASMRDASDFRQVCQSRESEHV